MPEVSRFYGLVIKMMFNDNDKHHKPHIHVYYGESEASVAIDGTVLEGRLPQRQYRMLSGWLAIHEEELYDDAQFCPNCGEDTTTKNELEVL